MSDGFSLTGRVLVLCESPEVLAAQLKGSGRAVDLAAAGPLRRRVSSEQLLPAPAAASCSDDKLARFCLTGLGGGVVQPGAVQAGGFQVLVAGEGFGQGPARDAAPFALREAGIRLIVARSVDSRFLRSCQNLGVHVTTDFGVLTRLLQTSAVPAQALLQGLDGLARDVVEAGGLFAYNEGRIAGRILGATVTGSRRPMTLVEKLIAAHVVRPKGLLGVPSVAPGQSYFIRADLRSAHGDAAALAETLFRNSFGQGAEVADPDSLALLRDDDTSEDEKGWDRATRALLDELALPGAVVIGTAPHTHAAGGLGALALQVGSAELASAFVTRDVRVKVPESVKIELFGELRLGVNVQDVVLTLLGSPAHVAGLFDGRALEFTGPGVASLDLEQRATLCDMALGASAFCGIVAFDKRARVELAERRGGDLDLPLSGVLSDADAQFAATIELDLGSVEPMVAR